MENIYDIILVGSGLSAVGCLLALENSGRKILLVDVGIRDNGKYKVPEGMDFLSLRYSDNEQYKYFTGEYLETMVWDKPMTGAQMTPPRKYVVERVEELQPVISNNFHPLESLSYGGLGNAWGLGCYVYSDGEIKKTGLDINDLKKAYSVITSLIGVAEPAGSAREYSFGDIRGTLPELKMDNSIEALYIRYNKKMDYFKKKGLYMGHPPLALLTEDINDRGHTLYNDMDFYSDNEKSAYRPWITIDKMISDGKIKYKGGIYVLSFKEENEYVSVLGYDIKKEENCLLYGRKLVLCTGALGTARLVIRSFNRQIKRLPVLSNHYTYMPCINFCQLGIPLSRNKTSMAQAVMFFDETGNKEDVISMALYTYRSLLLQRIIQESPFNYRESLRIMKYLQSAFVIFGIHYPDEYYEEKYLELRDGINSITNDYLYINFNQSKKIIKWIENKEGKIKRFLLKLGCIPLKSINPGNGASIHYGGVLPFNKEFNGIRLTNKGLLKPTNNVYIADSSGFQYLPAKGISFTIMANAYNVGINVKNEHSY